VLRLTIARFMEKLGFATRLCADGRAGVDALRGDALRGDAADIVLLDAAMPGMDGFAACAAMRALPAGARVPIIMISGFNDEASADRAFAVGASEYITKPVHWAVLRHRVRQLVAAAAAEQTLLDDRAFLQSPVDAIPDPTLVCDADGVVAWANKAALSACQLCDVALGRALPLHDDVCDAESEQIAGNALVRDPAQALITAGRSESACRQARRGGSGPLAEHRGEGARTPGGASPRQAPEASLRRHSWMPSPATRLSCAVGP
jgi:CheY-like chemotaxis protein